VFENVAFPLRVAKDRRYGRAEIQKLVDEALGTVGLARIKLWDGRLPAFEVD